METSQDSAVYALFALPFVLFCLGLAVFVIICHWKIYTKAGQAGWASLIPIYNIYILLKIVGKPWWWLLLFCIPLVNIIFAIWATNLLSKSFGKDIGFTLGLLFLSPIFYAIMAFDRTIVYHGPAGDPNKNNPFDEINAIGQKPA
ncbi:MAG TPA: DUF5684 domain-containing protein [Chitinophaga sp.]|uniref:DUF5684 domain-containing protein n=1 Tax=Chitinophaga sp. TaxID=1869181 RepID=UPI002CD090D2|nr:DUF5684 domain-containing protein [Chitinophaga sp.]HVI47430.1 DUF5684 domain-containing protein [Chitinophaga sp.]